MARAKAAKPKAEEPTDRDTDYWNARFRRVDKAPNGGWTLGRFRSKEGLVVELTQKSNGGSRVLSLGTWDVELRKQGPRGGWSWHDIVTDTVTEEIP